MIFLILLSIYIGVKIRFKCYKIDINKIIKGNKSSLFLSLATKIGVGSVIGTISSIIIGGFSSVIWLIIFSVITIPLVYSESKLGYKYRMNNTSGPYFIIKYGLNNKTLSIISMIIVIVLYSFLFQMIQINTISNLLKYTLNINKLCIIISIFTLLLTIIILDKNSITNIINRIVPLKCILFIILCLYGIITHIDKISFSFDFNIHSLLVGMVIGVKRSIFMNEILIGTTSISSGTDNNNLELSNEYQVLGIYFISIIRL